MGQLSPPGLDNNGIKHRSNQELVEKANALQSSFKLRIKSDVEERDFAKVRVEVEMLESADPQPENNAVAGIVNPVCSISDEIAAQKGTEEERKCQKESREESKEDDEIANSVDTAETAENDVTENE